MRPIDKKLEAYLNKVSHELALLRESLETVETEKDKLLKHTLQAITNAKRKAKQEENKCPFCRMERLKTLKEMEKVLVIKDYQLEILLALKGLTKLAALRLPGDFNYRRYFWAGYKDCYKDVEKILGLQKFEVKKTRSGTAERG